MELSTLAKRFGLTVKELKEVLIKAGWYRKDGSGFKKELKREKIVDLENNIINAKKMMELMTEYREKLTKVIHWRPFARKTLPFLYLKIQESIKESVALMKFINSKK